MKYLTAIGQPPGGSSSVHIHTQTIQKTTQKQYIEHKKYIEQHKNWEECGLCPVFAGFTLALALQLRKKHVKTSVKVVIHEQTHKNTRNVLPENRQTPTGRTSCTYNRFGRGLASRRMKTFSLLPEWNSFEIFLPWAHNEDIGRCGGKAALILNLGTEWWVASFTPRAILPSVPINCEAGWAVHPVETVWGRVKGGGGGIAPDGNKTTFTIAHAQPVA